MCAAKGHVRFTPKSGHVQCNEGCLLWANSGHWLICNRRPQWAANADGWAIGSAVKAISPLDTIYYRRRRYRW
jgi:hypothetical protein